MVPPDSEFTRQSAQQPTAPYTDQRGLAVYGYVEHGQRAAEIFDYPLQAEADAENRKTTPHQQFERLGHCEIGWPSRPRREQYQIVIAAPPQLGAGQVRSHRYDLRPGRADMRGQGVNKGILVVDQQHPP